MKKKLGLLLTAYFVTMLITGAVHASNLEDPLLEREVYEPRTLNMQAESGTSVMNENRTIIQEYGDISALGDGSITATLYSDDICDGILEITGVGDIIEWSFPDYSPWYNNGTSIKIVNISEGVTSIGSYAFYGCTSLSSINIPDSVTTIGNETFRSSGLTEITIPEGVTSIGNFVFSDCRLKSLAIPERVTSIGNYAFAWCDKLTEITIPNEVTSIGEGAFEGCSGLSEINIPDSVTSIGSNAFYGCSGLTEINIPASIGKDAFYGCSGLTSVTFKEGNQEISIGTWAFRGCSGLTEITISSNVIEIGGYAFRNCSSLTSVIFKEGSKLTSIGERAFEKCSSLTQIEIPTSVTSIGEGAFKGCSGLTSVIFEEGSQLTSIGSWAFYGCSGLIEITISSNVIEIGEYAFCNCTSLTSVTFKEGSQLTSIGEGAFESCSSLTEITIPSGVTNINIDMFWSCFSLNQINVSEENENYSDKDGVLFNKSKTEIIFYPEGKTETEYVIPESVTSIGASAFYNCSSLTSINIPTGVISIGSYAFRYCSGLTEITIPVGVTNIGDYAFEECENLKFVTTPLDFVYMFDAVENIIIQEGVTEIGYEAFSGMRDLESVTIPASVTSIGKKAFYSCTSLSSINIPDSVTTIGSYAFRYCSALTEITIPTTVTSIDSSAFRNCNNVIIYCTSNSFAHAYAEDYGIQYVLDDTAPEIEVQGYTEGWTNQDVTVTVEATDNLVGLAKGAYSFDGGTTWQEENEYTYKESANTQIKVRDALGNISKYEVEIKIDKKNPSIESMEGIPENWSTKDVEIKILGEDNLSGLTEKPYSFDGGVTWQETGEYTYTQSTNTQIQVKDKAGNIEEQEVEIKIDKETPTIKVEGDLKNWTRGNIKVTVEAEDNISGLAEKAYSFDGGENWQEEGEYTYTEYTKTQLQVRDIAGNIEVYDIEAKIDKLAPKIEEVEISTTEWTKEVELSIVGARDNESGLAEEAYSFDGGATWQKGSSKIFTENKEGIVIYVRDDIGNIMIYDDILNIRNIIELKEIEVKETPEKTEYILGEETNIEGLIIEQIFNNGDIKELTEEYTYLPKVFEQEGLQQITLQYKDKTTTIEVNVQKLEVTSELYKVEEKLVSNIQPGTTVKEIKEKITTNANTIKLYNKEGDELKDEDCVTTKTKIKLNNIEEYSLVVRGDATGDGKSDIKDILQINKHRLNKVKLEVEYLKAADVDGNNIADIKDILKINKYRLNKIEIL